MALPDTIEIGRLQMTDLATDLSAVIEKHVRETQMDHTLVTSALGAALGSVACGQTDSKGGALAMVSIASELAAEYVEFQNRHG